MFNNNMMGGYPPPYMQQPRYVPQAPESPYNQLSQQPNIQYTPMQQNIPNGLQGKMVDSIDVVKAMEFPLDGSISYFPLTDGSAILTKQLQADGSSKIVMYKAVEMDKTKTEKVNYVTKEELKEITSKEPEGMKEVKEEIKNLKRQIRDLSDDIKDYKRKE